MPVILAKVVDIVHRRRHDVMAKYGNEGGEDVKSVVGILSELRYQLTTDKPIQPLETSLPDQRMWSDFLREQTAQAGGDENEVTWFKSSWLHAECYMYRRIAAAFEKSVHLEEFDPFSFLKEQAYLHSLEAISVLGGFLTDVSDKLKADKMNSSERREVLEELIQLSLWGNKCDLSMSAGEHHKLDSDAVLKQTEALKTNIVINHLTRLTDFILDMKNKAEDVVVHFVLDNAGMELFSDLCLAEFLLESSLAAKIVFHTKDIPWFVSDTISADFSWTLEMLRSSHCQSLSRLGHLWCNRLETGEFVLASHPFWTSPYSFDRMSTASPELYRTLSQASLILFKGDLNYRKLTGDLKWPFYTEFETALRGFYPAPFVALRTLKADICVGLEATVVSALMDRHRDTIEWTYSGNYAVIQAKLDSR